MKHKRLTNWNNFGYCSTP